MKKVLALTLALVMVFALCACGQAPAKNEGPETIKIGFAFPMSGTAAMAGKYSTHGADVVKEALGGKLEVNGVGYRAQKQGNELVLNIGYSHLVKVPEIDGITIDVPNTNTVIIKGIDKQLVGQFAADVRSKRPPEPYKGKGIKYADEVIRRKEGKTGGK